MKKMQEWLISVLYKKCKQDTGGVQSIVLYEQVIPFRKCFNFIIVRISDFSVYEFDFKHAPGKGFHGTIQCFTKCCISIMYYLTLIIYNMNIREIKRGGGVLRNRWRKFSAMAIADIPQVLYYRKVLNNVITSISGRPSQNGSR